LFNDFILNLASGLSDNPWLQGLLIVIGTFILEDATTIGCGLLVADGSVGFTTAAIALPMGIAIGDLGLYVIGRFLGDRAMRWGLIQHRHMDKAEDWFRRNLFSAVVLTRFVPGMRTPTYVAAGLSRAPFIKFMLLVVAASLAWSLLLLKIVVHLGRSVMPLLGTWKWPMALAAIAVIVVIQATQGKRMLRRTGIIGGESAAEKVSTFFEFWPPLLFYFPVGLYYLRLALKYRCASLPSVVNPNIYSGGIVFESKTGILDQVPEAHRRWIASYVPFVPAENGAGIEERMKAAHEVLARTGIAFPLVAKPDVGQRGAGVQLIQNEEELRQYLATFPAKQKMIFQRYIPHPVEAGIMVLRFPGRRHGRIISITLKTFPKVTGDGKRSLKELIHDDPLLRARWMILHRRFKQQWNRVLAPGEAMRLVFSGNHCQGAIFRNGMHLVTPALTQRFVEIARSLPEYHFGRFDVRFPSIDALKRGEDFQIIEINGAASEAIHIWDNHITLRQAYTTYFRQMHLLFEIGARNRERGHEPMPAMQILKDFMAYRRLVRHYPPTS